MKYESLEQTGIQTWVLFYLPKCVNQLSVVVTNIQVKSTLKPERFILVHSFEGFISQPRGSVVSGSVVRYIITMRSAQWSKAQERKRMRKGRGWKLSSKVIQLSSTRPHLQRSHHLPAQLQTEDIAFHTLDSRGCSKSKL